MHMVNPVWARPLALALWMFAIIGFGQWLTGGEWHGDEWVATPHAGTAAIILGFIGLVLWVASIRIPEAPRGYEEGQGLLDNYYDGDIS